VTVVSGSSPLIALAQIGHFDILRALFSRVCISEEVLQEVVVAGTGLPASLEVAESDWIETHKLQNLPELFSLRERYRLGVGELSAVCSGERIES
jgi:predicted nucleic acid-binding protein